MSQRIEKLIDSFEEAVASVGHPYHEAALELLYAFEQMALTKGKERHANDLPFTEQKMQKIADAQGTTAGLTYQISKKAIEADRLSLEKAIQERYGAIVYAVGANIWDKRNLLAQTAPEEAQTDKEQADGEEQPERGEHGPIEVGQADEAEEQEKATGRESLKKYDPADFLKYDLEREQYLISHVQGALENGDPLEDAITRACRAVVESVRREYGTKPAAQSPAVLDEESEKPVTKAPLVLSEEEQREQDRADHDIENWNPCSVHVAQCCYCGQKPRIYKYRGAYNPPYPYHLQHTHAVCPIKQQLDHFDTHFDACRRKWSEHNTRNEDC